MAQEFKPYPKADITASEWAVYFDDVRRRHQATAQDINDQNLLIYTDNATHTVFSFTKPGHPAHPAWIARRPVNKGNSIHIAQIGYFAGAEPPFAKLFSEYLALNQKLMEGINSGQEQLEKSDLRPAN